MLKVQGSSCKWKEIWEICVGHALHSFIIYKARVAKEIICFTFHLTCYRFGTLCGPSTLLHLKPGLKSSQATDCINWYLKYSFWNFCKSLPKKIFVNSSCPGSFNSYMNITMYTVYIHKWTSQCSTYHLPRIRAVKALQQCHYCTLSTSRCTNQCDSLSRFHFKI